MINFITYGLPNSFKWDIQSDFKGKVIYTRQWRVAMCAKV